MFAYLEQIKQTPENLELASARTKDSDEEMCEKLPNRLTLAPKKDKQMPRCHKKTTHDLPQKAYAWIKKLDPLLWLCPLVFALLFSRTFKPQVRTSVSFPRRTSYWEPWAKENGKYTLRMSLETGSNPSLDLMQPQAMIRRLWCLTWRGEILLPLAWFISLLALSVQVMHKIHIHQAAMCIFT